jgi:hypothetical protein
VGSCPKCGATGKLWKLKLSANVRAVASLRYLHERKYWKTHPVLLSIVLAVVLGSPFLGLVLAGWPGVTVGLVVSVAGFVAGLFAVTRVHHTREGES